MTIRAEVVERLREGVLDLGEVRGAASLDAILKGRVSFPGAYVFLDSSRSTENRLIGAVGQREERVYGIVLAVRNVADARGGDGADESERLCRLIQSALIGFQPEGSDFPLEYAGGNLVSLEGGIHCYLERYRTSVLHFAVST